MTISISTTKARAKRLRQYLASIGASLSHSQSLEAISHEEGYKDWNTYTACMHGQETPANSDGPFPPVRVGESVTGNFRGSAFKGTVLGLEKTDGGPAQLGPVWRIKIQFDAPVELPAPEGLDLTRLRVRQMINGTGQSVNLKGRLDGHMQLTLPK